ncbi:ABC transporter ATP-binding protein [Thermodesulfobacteriota bacterium]
MTPLVQVKGISKSFTNSGARIDILKNIDMDLNKGETLAIEGASGIGKSTFLHILGTLDYPDSGKLLFRDEDVFGFDKDKLAKFRNESIGFVFQFHHLLPGFNAIENAMMPALINGLKKEKAFRSAEEILVRVGLKDRLHHQVSRLSGGEQQRVALARALILQPVILLADEPTGNLDKHNSEQVHNLLLELNKELTMTMVVVTHNRELASCMLRCVTIYDGQLLERQ